MGIEQESVRILPRLRGGKGQCRHTAHNRWSNRRGDAQPHSGAAVAMPRADRMREQKPDKAGSQPTACPPLTNWRTIDVRREPGRPGGLDTVGVVRSPSHFRHADRELGLLKEPMRWATPVPPSHRRAWWRQPISAVTDALGTLGPIRMPSSRYAARSDTKARGRLSSRTRARRTLSQTMSQKGFRWFAEIKNSPKIDRPKRS
jgi:hypothetical protein